MNYRTGFKVFALCFAFVAGLGVSFPAFAEDENDEDFDFMEIPLEELVEIEVITITARKREESMQETPVSVTAFTGQNLEDRGIRRIEELSKFVPNLTFEDGAVRGASIYIRGVGQRDTRQSLEPGVGVYIDGVYVARQSALLPLLDVERVEVLRGPQGTLYGRNTIGGAINYVSKKPGPDVEVSAEIRGGNFNLFESRGSINLPIVDNLLFSRLAIATKSRRGYTTNVADDDHWDDDSLLAISPAFRLTPFEDLLTIDLNGHYTRQNMRQRGGKCFVSDPDNATVGAFEAANFLVGADNPDLHGTCDRDSDLGFYKFSASTSGIYRLETYGVAGTINVDPGSFWIFDDINFKSITAWNVQSEWDKQNDLDGTEEPLIDRAYYHAHDITTTSEELTWTSSTTFGDVLPFLPDSIGKGEIRPTIGGFLSWEESDKGRQDNVALGGGEPLIIPFDIGGGVFVPFDITNSADPQRFNIPQIDNKSRAVYTQWTFEPHEYLQLTGGVRYTWEKKALERFEPGATGRRSDTFSKWTPMANVTLLAPESWLNVASAETGILYYTYAEGFKSGGFNELTDEETGDPIPAFGQENLKSHEVGIKLNLFDKKVLLNAAYFHNKYEDLQLTVTRVNPDTNAFGSTITNAGESTIDGFEIEVTAIPIRGLQANASVGYLDAGYDEFEDSVPGMPGETQDRSDEPLLNVPKWTANAGLQYTLLLGKLVGDWDFGRITPRWDYAYMGKRAFHLTRSGYESGLFDEDGVSLHAVRLTWESASLHYRAAFWMNNVFDKKYIDGAVDLTDFFGTGQTRAGAPRMLGFELAYRYF